MEPEENLLSFFFFVIVIDLLNDNLAFQIFKRTRLSLLFDRSYKSIIGAIFVVLCFLYSNFLRVKRR